MKDIQRKSLNEAKIDPMERVTPSHIFFDRRRLFYRLGLGGLAMSAGLGSGCEGRGSGTWLVGGPGEPAFSPGAATSHTIPGSVERRSITPREVASPPSPNGC